MSFIVTFLYFGEGSSFIKIMVRYFFVDMSFDWLMFFCSFQAEYFIISNFSWLLFIILFPLFFLSVNSNYKGDCFI